MAALRTPAVAGSFYPGLPGELRSEVGRHLAPALASHASAGGAPGEVAPKILVVPHAGYNYSGATAARAYALLAPVAARIRRVVLLGPILFRYEGAALVDVFGSTCRPSCESGSCSSFA
jgi:AmmeMemoRadiSam system protein B